MGRETSIKKIEESGLVAVIRLDKVDKLEKIITALSNADLKAIEITMTTPNAIDIIKELNAKISSEFLLGAGSVLDSETARAAMLAGAEFIVSPILKTEMIQMVHRYDKVIVPGAFTPNEIITAWENGADIVKVFPASFMGPKYFKAIHGPLPQVKLSPTGGVNMDNATAFIKAGASFLGVGSALVKKEMVKNSNWEALEEHARKFKKVVDEARINK